MRWDDPLNARLDRLEASTKRIKESLVCYLAQQTGQTEAQVWARMVEAREKRLANPPHP